MADIEYKTDIPGIFKTKEGFLLNKDNDSLTAYKKKKEQAKNVKKMENDFKEIKSEIQEIKELLRGLVK